MMQLDLAQVFDVPLMRAETMPNRALQFMDKNMVDIAIQEILDPLKTLATSRGHSQKYIDALTVQKDGWLKISIILKQFRGPNNIPLATLLEYGWDSHEIQFNPVGHWTGGKYGPGDHFAASIQHPGFPGYHLFTSLKNWGFIDQFIRVLGERTSQYLKEVAFGQ